MAHNWAMYLNEIAEHASGAAIAQRLQVSDSKVSYWRRGERPPTPREAAHVARTFGRSALEGLVAAGYLEEADLSDEVTVIGHTLADYTDVELAQEVLQRAIRALPGGPAVE